MKSPDRGQPVIGDALARATAERLEKDGVKRVTPEAISRFSGRPGEKLATGKVRARKRRPGIGLSM